MTTDPLLTDDLATLLGQFPNEALADIVDILKQHSSWSPLPAQRAYDAHKLPRSGNFRVHSGEIAREVLWWGSHDLHRQWGDVPTWKALLVGTAEHLKVAESDRDSNLPAWKIENAIFRTALDAWERLTPEEREATMKKAGMDRGALKGAMVAAAGGVASLGARQLVAFLAARGAGAAVPFIGPILGAVGAAWAAYDLAGPSYRVLRPATLVIAFHRRQLRDARAASAFRD
jgi:hypothetical protein